MSKNSFIINNLKARLAKKKHHGTFSSETCNSQKVLTLPSESYVSFYQTKNAESYSTKIKVQEE